MVMIFAVMGCATYPVTTTVVTQPGKRVTAEKSKFSIFWLTPLPAETAGGLVDELLEKCNGQDLTGVTVSVERAWVIVGENMRIVWNVNVLDARWTRPVKTLTKTAKQTSVKAKM